MIFSFSVCSPIACHDSKQQIVCNSEFRNHEFRQDTKENRRKIASAYGCSWPFFILVDSDMMNVSLLQLQGIISQKNQTWINDPVTQLGLSLSFHIRNSKCMLYTVSDGYACAYISWCI